MNFKKRGSASSVLDVVLTNTGKTTEEFFDDEVKEYNIQDLDKVSNVINEAIFDGTPISVVGDYDADGITSCAILTLLFQTFGVTPCIRIPKRMSEGYGLSEFIIDEIDSGLLITVDNGIVAYDAIKKAKDKGLKVIIMDHHLGPEDGLLPPADLIIDPNAIENQADFNGYCGAGLSYKLACKMLGNHPVLKKMVAFAAIGTVADVMPLIEDNRNIVKQGIAAMKTKGCCTAGLQALLENCCLDKYLNAKNIAFKIGPILNAPGRLQDDGANKSLQLLTFDGNKMQAIKMADELSAMNTERKEMSKDCIDILKENIQINCLFGDCPMTVYQPGLPEGLMGIFAGRLAEEFQVPCIVLTDSEEPGILKGSARSARGVHLKNLFDANSALLERYGGHAEAAGLSLKLENLETFRLSIQKNVELADAEDSILYYDLEISPTEIPNIIKELEKYGPFGEGNPEPVFLVNDLNLYPIPYGDSEFNSFARLMGENKEHIKFAGKDVTLVAFDKADQYRRLKNPKKLNVLGTLSINAWHAKMENQIEVMDFDSAESEKPITSFAAQLAKMAADR